MARYNTVSKILTLPGATTLSYIIDGGTVVLTGTPGYTVTLVNPSLYSGASQTFHNSTSGSVTLSTPAGNIVGSGFAAASSQSIPANASYTTTSDGTNWVVVNNTGGPIAVTSAAASSTVTLSPVDSAVEISPSGTGANVAVQPAGTLTLSSTGNLTMNPGGTLTVNPTGAASLTGSSTLTLGSLGQTTTMNGNISATASNQTVSFSPSGTGSVTISPTGSGGLTVNPTTTGSINNVNIGATTAGTGRFTTITATTSATLQAGTVATAPSNGNDIANKTYVDTQTSAVGLTSTIAADTTLAANKMAFTMDTLTISGSAVYTINNGAYHMCMNPDGFALFN